MIGRTCLFPASQSVRNPAWRIALCVGLTLVAAELRGQSPRGAASKSASTSGTASAKSAAQNPDVVTFQKMVEPSFRIQPIVHRLEGRRGESIPFSYAIESTGKEMNVELEVVCLRQEESGIAVYDEKGAAPKAVKLFTPRQFTVSPGKATTIRGEVTIPAAKANFYSLGILVKDLGQNTKLDPQFDTAGKRKTQAGVRFITQYVLRCDVDVLNGAGDDLNNVLLESAQLYPQQGLPMARVFLSNPTDNAFEFRVRASFAGDAETRGRDFPLGMPCRADLDNDERHLVRLLPKSRIRLEAPVPHSLLPGSYDLRVEVSSGMRVACSEKFVVDVSPGDFPALDVTVATVGGVSVSPAQIEMSQLRGGKRNASLRFTNSSDVPQTVRLLPQSLEGAPLTELTLPDESFILPPGGSRRITAMLRYKGDLKTARYGYLGVETQTGDGGPQSGKIPVALLYGPWDEAAVEYSDIAWRPAGKRPAFVVEATNRGKGFVPINGTLIVADEQGRSMMVTAGHGRWLQPGETMPLEFRLGRHLPPGNYQLSMQLMTSQNAEPVSTNTVIRVGDP